MGVPVLYSCRLCYYFVRRLALTRWPKVIWEQAASTLLVAHPLIVAAHNRPTVLARWRQCARPYKTRFLGPTRSTTPSGIWIASAVFSQYTFVTNGRRQNSTGKNRPPLTLYLAERATPSNNNNDIVTGLACVECVHTGYALRCVALSCGTKRCRQTPHSTATQRTASDVKKNLNCNNTRWTMFSRHCLWKDGGSINASDLIFR